MRKLHPKLYPRPWYYRWFLRWFPGNQKTSVNDPEFWKTRYAEHLWYGDSRAAVVVRTNPLTIAAYTDELDCIVLLEFPNFLRKYYQLEVGSMLMTVNLYHRGHVPVFDLERGPLGRNKYRNFTPFIGNFLSDDQDRIDQRVNEIKEEEWQRTWQLAQEYIAKHGWRCRNGLPMNADKPRKSLSLD